MQEFYGPVVYAQAPNDPLNKGIPTDGKTNQFWPMGAGLHGAMSTHGPSEMEFQEAMNVDTMRPHKVQAEGVAWFILEMERPLGLSEWAHECANRNMQAQEQQLANM
jgi:homogentisate 1,2-dioxygenase